MNTSDDNGLKEFLDACEREIRELQGLKALEVWYNRRLNEARMPYHDRIRRLTEQGRDVTADDRDKIGQETGATARSRELLRMYERAVREFVGRAAKDLSDPDSESYREIVRKYDAAWKELANK